MYSPPDFGVFINNRKWEILKMGTPVFASQKAELLRIFKNLFNYEYYSI